MEETIKQQMENILISVDRQTQSLCNELDTKIEKIQLGLQVVTVSLDLRTQGLRYGLSARIEEMQRDIEMSLGTRTRSLYEEIADKKRDLREEMADTKRNFNEELDCKILEARLDIQATKIQVEVTRRELRTQPDRSSHLTGQQEQVYA
jgi:hypothetical protein